MGNENRAIDLVFVCFYWNVTAQCVEWEYIDVVCEGSEEVKNNFAYVHEAFLKAFERIQKIVAEKANSTLRGVDIFSDGGPNHFKISSTNAFFSTLKAKYNLIRLRWLFFASYHGSSLCDGHAAVIHHVLNAVAFNEDKPWHTVDELIAAIKERCSRACPIKLDRVPTSLELPLSFEVKTLEGIRSRFFFFEAVKNGVVSIRPHVGARLLPWPTHKCGYVNATVNTGLAVNFKDRRRPRER
eukprot:g81440.t1